MSLRQGMENTSERSQTKDNSTMVAITDGFSAFHTELDTVRANMLGSKGTLFNAERTPQTDSAQQSALDKAKDTNIYASVFAGKSANGQADTTAKAKGVQHADEWLASVA